MFYSKDYKQLNIIDPWRQMGPKHRMMLNKSWAGLFRREILVEAPVDALREYYHDSDGRPTKELFSMVGLMILQQMHDLTDEQAVEQFCFNVQWRYALDVTDDADAYSYVSLRSLWAMRDHLTEKGLHKTLFETVAQKLAKVFKVDFSKQRIDSVHIQSNMRRLGRISLCVKTIKKFLVNLKRHHPIVLDELDEALRSQIPRQEARGGFRTGEAVTVIYDAESGGPMDQPGHRTSWRGVPPVSGYYERQRGSNRRRSVAVGG